MLIKLIRKLLGIEDLARDNAELARKVENLEVNKANRRKSKKNKEAEEDEAIPY